MNATNHQLELGLDGDAASTAVEAAIVLPDYAVTEDSTPAAIIAWWDKLVAAFTQEAEAIRPELTYLESELAGLKGQRTGVSRRRAAQLRAARENLLARAEAVEFAAYGLFEGTLGEFSPRLIALMQAQGLDVPDDDEMAVAEFWDCLQRPAIEWCAELSLRDIIREFCDRNAA